MQSTAVTTVFISERDRKGESYIMLSAEEIDALRQAITMNSIDLM